jgi:hypothetical protein
MKRLFAAAFGLAAAFGCAHADRYSLPPKLAYVPPGTTLVAVPKELDCTMFTVLDDGSAAVDWKCVDAWAATHDPYNDMDDIARLLKAVHEGRAQ